ncbi:hypothetical protein ABB37_00032 [Leptomonas pyrrhocoris]|uniref:Uncharacterized protein n=1 Tax=Leptomonas pyrrhocoris TaxID=157538 RepID=A0A0M9G9U0_LEPPY|nr:hypothetical protein ABB37_00032 [Leptomonas pyrrhocoris]KPA85629.1 hypothetical protein ABB37_00032 [Leptomonas pyrrhocoris]|eukprot:XP_015664068.1 hypothetical protein ABB37_00032 [Leptomonas pyrrhocoris]
MAAPQPFLRELLALKKQEATSLFGPWDVEDEGRIAVKQVRPLLLSVFPEAANTAPYLTLGRVRAAYEGVTHRPWHASTGVVTASASSYHAHRLGGPMYAGPTLEEVLRMIDSLAASPEERLSTVPSPVQESARPSTPPLPTHRRPLPFSAPFTQVHPADQEVVDAGRKAGSAAAEATSTESYLRLLRGSIEHIYHAFCAACKQAGEPAPTALPTDAAHLQRLAWNIQARPLQLGENRALHRLLAAATNSGDDKQQGSGGVRASRISPDDFVLLLCAL